MSATHYPRRTPAGARLSITTWGRDFTMVDIDRWPIADWPEAARPELRRLGDALAELAVRCRRNVRAAFMSSFVSGGAIYCPNAVVDELLAVLVSAEEGDVSRVTPVADMAEEAAAAVAAVRSKGAKLVAARLALEQFVAGVKGQAPTAAGGHRPSPARSPARSHSSPS